MKALVLTAPSEFHYDLEFPEPTAAAGEVLVKIAACGICGSDIHGMDGRSGRRQMPIVMGHEAAGEIIALGEGVEGWNLGDRVTFDSTEYCGECEECKAGFVNLCPNCQRASSTASRMTSLMRRQLLPSRCPSPCMR
jgi:L-iditol 2-dehydrogenase